MLEVTPSAWNESVRYANGSRILTTSRKRLKSSAPQLNPGIGEEKLTRNFEDLRVNDNFKKAARLLLIYQNTEQLASMKNIFCNLCGKRGHAVSFIYAHEKRVCLYSFGL
jgi:hypothetical protein